MANLVYITVNGTYLLPDGITPQIGYIEFRPSVPLVRSGTGIIVSEPIQAVLDKTGSFSISLLATDNPELVPTGWSWSVDEKIKNGTSWFFQLPVAGPNPLNISDVYSISDTGIGLDQLTADRRYVNLVGDTMTGPLILSGPPDVDLGAATKKYTSDAMAAHVALPDPHNQYLLKATASSIMPLFVTHPAGQIVSSSVGYVHIPLNPTPEYSIGSGISVIAGDLNVTDYGNYLISLNFNWLTLDSTGYQGLIRIVAGGKTYDFRGVGGSMLSQSYTPITGSMVVPMTTTKIVTVSVLVEVAGTFWNTGLDLLNSRLAITKLL